METEANKMAKQPSYRFAGYTEAWEQKKLGAYLTVSKNRNVDGEYDKSDVLSVSGDYGIVNQIKFQGRSFAGASVLPYGIVETGDVVYTKSPLKANPYGIIKTNHGKNGIVSTLYAIYKINNGSNGVFVEYYFDDNLRLNKYLKPLVNKGAKNDMKVTDENVLKGDVIFPSLPEQTAIGSFFQDIDHLISLQRCRLEVLKEQKKTYLKLLFPAKGQTKPSLRFTGFEDEWKEVKLGEVVASERKGKAKSEMIGNKSVYLETTYLNGGKQTRVDCDCDTSKEDIIILWDGSQAGAVYYGFEGALGSTLKSYKIFGSGSFYYQQMKASQSLIFERYRTPNIPHVIKSFLDDFYIFTTSLPEQEVIGSFFQDLDKVIAKQEEKVNQLKESKRTFLKKMFI